MATLNCILESFSKSSCPAAELRVLVPAWSGSQAWWPRLCGAAQSGRKAGRGSGPGLLAPPLSLACCAWPPRSACRIHRLLLGCLISSAARGVERNRLPQTWWAAPTPRYLAPQPPPAPCSRCRPFLLLFLASSRPCFVCSCLFSCLSLSVFSLQGSGGRVRVVVIPKAELIHLYRSLWLAQMSVGQRYLSQNLGSALASLVISSNCSALSLFPL